MNITLEKDQKTVSYKADAAYYLLLAYIPLVGPLITLVMVIIKKQFRGIIINMFLISFIITFVSVIFFISNINILVNITNLFGFILIIYINLMYIFKANQYSVKQRLAEGYKITSPIDTQTKLFLDKVERTNRPFWQLVKF